jgi:hypothetical protein
MTVEKAMDSKSIKLLLEAGAIKNVSIIAEGSTIHAVITTNSGTPQPATTLKGDLKIWSTIDSAAKYIRSLGVGKVKLEFSKWNPKQKGLL